ncbi:MAG TPA: hypothetical protein ENI38_02045 [Candidatus Acetothermia bacterium]|nr:hypothetical protein [Candidatus Acetothermia bacterium]
MREISKSAFRGREVLYPVPEAFGQSTAASNKDYGLDWSDFQIMVTCLGAQGVEADPDKAIFPKVDISTQVGGINDRCPGLHRSSQKPLGGGWPSAPPWRG